MNGLFNRVYDTLRITKPFNNLQTASKRLLIYRYNSTIPVTPTSSPSKVSHPELSHLTESTTALAFRSIPYGSPNHLIFGSPGAIIFNHSSPPFFTLRILQSSPRSHSQSNSSNRRISPMSNKSRGAPPPTLHHTTSSDPLNPFLTKEEMRKRQIGLKKFKKGWTMDLTIMVGKKKVHKSAVVREQCKRRLREAIRLVVMRGAFVEDGIIKFDQDSEGPRKWLVGGFSYVASGTLELFRCDFPTLVEQVRNALKTLKIKTENQIVERQLAQIPAPARDNSILDEKHD